MDNINDKNAKILTEEIFKEDAKRFEEVIEKERKNPISFFDLVHWKDIIASSTILPEHEQSGLELIERRLGYLPHVCVYTPFEPYLRGLINSHQRGFLTDEQYTIDVDEHIKLIRNADVKRAGWHKKLEYTDQDYRMYERNRIIYKEKARARICMLLGYVPELKYSLEAEVKMREFFREESHWERGWYIFDFFIITIIKYREYLLDHGQEAADQSPLISFQPVILK